MIKHKNKKKISITLDDFILNSIERLLEDPRFRNRSHIIEYCINKFLEEDKNAKV